MPQTGNGGFPLDVFVGFDIPNEFVVGYGLDYQDAYRNLPYVAALEPAEIESCPP